MRVFQKNAILKQSLGIARIEFKCYRAARAQWTVTMKDGEEFNISTHNFGSESTVIRLAAEKLAKSGRGVEYPKGA